MSGPNFQGMIEEWALTSYQQTRQSQDQRNGLSANVRAEVSWEKCDFHLKETFWDKVQQNAINTSRNIILNGNYKNNGGTEMKQTIKVDKSVEAHFRASLTEGKTTGLGMNLRVPLPEQLTQKTSAFGRSICINTNEETNRSAEMTWSIDTVITIPPRSVTNAQVILHENSFLVNFKGKACLNGHVVVSIYNKNTGAFLTTVENDVLEIWRWHLQKNIRAHSVSIDNGSPGLMWPVKGLCFFHFGVEHEVTLSPQVITHVPLHKPDESNSGCTVC